MAVRVYKTLPDELLAAADAIADHFDGMGYRSHVEHSELGFPFTPTLLCRRGKITTVMIEVDSEIRPRKLDDWIRYARSSSKDTRIAVCLPSTVDVPPERMAELRDKGVGLYFAFPERVVEQIGLADLALNVALPELRSLPQPIRELLGDA